MTKTKTTYPPTKMTTKSVFLFLLWSCQASAFSAPTTPAKNIVGYQQQQQQVGRRQKSSLYHHGGANQNDKNDEKTRILPKTSTLFGSLASSTLAAVALNAAVFLYPVLPAAAAATTNPDIQGIGAVTQSQLGQSVRRTVVGGAQLADSIDLKWERFSDSLRDEQKCDPRTNRRMFDNGTRRDGTKIGNPVLGALCTPEPLKAVDTEFAKTVVQQLATEAMKEIGVVGGGVGSGSETELQKKVDEIKVKVGPAFSRAASSSVGDGASSSSSSSPEDIEQERKRQDFNRDLYVQMRAYGEEIIKVTSASNNNNNNNNNKNVQRDTARAFEKTWGNKLLTTLAPNANRNDYSSPFPKPDPSDEQPYDEGALLDALGKVSVALGKLQNAGLIGHWEISIPEDDYWNVVTLAIDDDISIGGQMLARESNVQPSLSGSAVVALVKSAMEDQAKISYKMDTFFIDPTTTKQELYNPTQLLVSLSDLGQ